MIRDELNYYYVGLYLLMDGDEPRFAKLQYGTGKAGQIIMQRGNRPIVGGGSLVGRVLQNHKACIALDVGDDAVKFDNPWLPDTRSVIVLPLGRKRLVGALVIHSFEEAAFSDEDIPLLQSIADELADATQGSQSIKEGLY